MTTRRSSGRVVIARPPDTWGPWRSVMTDCFVAVLLAMTFSIGLMFQKRPIIVIERRAQEKRIKTVQYPAVPGQDQRRVLGAGAALQDRLAQVGHKRQESNQKS